ncbi:hypothetical protein C8R43DRAFT_943185 [Mycena crocata]|nr:hypothetical protein C8R43DRAFT_943185 [Mycena crocata]
MGPSLSRPVDTAQWTISLLYRSSSQAIIRALCCSVFGKEKQAARASIFVPAPFGRVNRRCNSNCRRRSLDRSRRSAAYASASSMRACNASGSGRGPAMSPPAAASSRDLDRQRLDEMLQVRRDETLYNAEILSQQWQEEGRTENTCRLFGVELIQVEIKMIQQNMVNETEKETPDHVLSLPLLRTPLSFAGMDLTALDGSSTNRPWTLDEQGSLVLASSSEEDVNDRYDRFMAIRTTTSSTRSSTRTSAPAAGPNSNASMRSISTTSISTRSTGTTVPMRKTLKRAKPFDINRTPPRGWEFRPPIRHAPSAGMTRVRKKPFPGRRAERDEPLVSDDLYLTDARPPILRGVKPYHQCLICYNLKSHPTWQFCLRPQRLLCMKPMTEKHQLRDNLHPTSMARSKLPPRSRKPSKAIVYNRLRRRYKKWAGLGITDAEILRDGWAWNDVQAAPTDYSGNGWTSNNGWGGGGWGDVDVDTDPDNPWVGEGWGDQWDGAAAADVSTTVASE